MIISEPLPCWWSNAKGVDQLRIVPPDIAASIFQEVHIFLTRMLCECIEAVIFSA